MSNLSDSEVGIAKITAFLSIPELIGVVKLSCREDDFNEVQNILMERERKMEVELECVRRDFESYKKDAGLVERSLSMEKVRVEGQLQRSERKCGELGEVVRRLEEEKGVCLERAKRAEEMYENVLEENLRVVSERSKEIDELEGRILENEGLVGEYRERLKGVDREMEELRGKQVEVDRVVEEMKGMEREMKELRWGKLGADRMVEELRRKQVEVDGVVEELKGRILELGQEKMDSEVVEEKLRLSERKCEELEEENKRLSEEEGVCLDRVKRAEEMYEKASKENLRMMSEKNKEIRILENEGLVGEYRQELKCRDARILEMDREIERLRRKQVEVGNLVEEMKDQIIALRRENMKLKGDEVNLRMMNEKNNEINDLKIRILENEELVGEYCQELKCRDARILEMDREIERLRRKQMEAGNLVEEMKDVIIVLRRENMKLKGGEVNLRMMNEKNKEINDLKIRILENEGLVGEYREELKCRDARILEMDREMEGLRGKQVEVDKVMEELKARNHELGVGNMESKKAVEVYKSRFENLAPRVAKVEVGLAGMLNVKVKDLARIVQNAEKSGGGAEEVNVDSRGNFKGRKAFVPSNSTGSGGVSKKGGINFANSQSKKDGGPAVRASGCKPCRVKSNDTAQQNVLEKLQVSGGGNLANSQSKEDGAPAVRASGCKPFLVKSNITARQNVTEEPTVSGSSSQCSSKAARPSSASDVILIGDSDEKETNPGATPSAGLTKKRKRTGFPSGKF